MARGKLSPTLKARIKNASRAAAAHRLRGNMVMANHQQSLVDSRVAEAERQGHGDEAFEAEIAGTQLAESQFSASKYGRDPRGKGRQEWYILLFDTRGAFSTFETVTGDKAKALRKAAQYRVKSNGYSKVEVTKHHPSASRRSKGRWDRHVAKHNRAARKWGMGTYRDPASARRRAKGRRLNPYSRFVKSHKGSGLTFSEIAKLWRRKKRAATTSTRLKRHVTKHTRKGTKMTTRALPKELLDLARALREASAKEPSAAKASAIERKMESLIRQLRKAQKSAGAKARNEREAEEIRAQAREWASKGPSGDPTRRKKSAYQRFLKAHKGKGLSLKALRSKWKRLTASGKAKYGHAKKRRKSHRDPGYRRAAHHRAHRARRHRGARRHHRPY